MFSIDTDDIKNTALSQENIQIINELEEELERIKKICTPKKKLRI